METDESYIHPHTNERVEKAGWSWTWDGAKTVIDYLIEQGKVTYCENVGFKLLK